MNSVVTAIMRSLTPEIIAGLTSAAGLDSSTAQRAIGAVVPSILTGLANIAGTPGGARHLANAVAQQPSNIFEGLASTLTGSAQTTQIAEKGMGLLSSLFGGGALDTLASTVSKFAGIGEGTTQTLMGLLTPLIMAVLGREQRNANLDAGGLARMLTSQKDEIAAAMPAGLSRLLDASGLYKAMAPTTSVEQIHDSVRPAYDPARASSPPRVVSASKAKPQAANWAYWVLPLLALGGLLMYMLSSGRQTVEPVRTSESKATYLTSVPDTWVSIRGRPNDYVNHDIYNRAGEKLGTIKDVLVGADDKVTAAVINVGRYLGLGDKDVAVPYAALQIEQRDNTQRIVIDATRENLQAAPPFKGKP